MLYRIRYRQNDSSREGEATVEANSPNEAVVKFRCTTSWRTGNQGPGQEITSVQAEQPAAW